ncbi:N-acetyl sugar amidotransferase [Rhodocyclus tenuis]|uniref:N-acetyl sugar amidotransferase n=1 Tax=Rhodocyclus gracilis TaxID=2929842 RepID=A0ABX0WIQ7_9RHOO|nr:N-acetyl sugar amidotransferase [Rhodocyclus gracilis]MRD72303.1 N-acetyl sugar amidotransferase [Rhodocyclus gracilis]NJA89608.1 N-acetyl sugar amidotransferase [Rhodocyclus gracilis]
MLLNPDIDNAGVRICSRCIYDERVPSIEFDENGVCNYCRQVDALAELYGTGDAKGLNSFYEILDSIKKNGKGNKYDCIVGVSGGTDSSYLVAMAKEWGLRPLAVHYDNTWNSSIATTNIHKVLSCLNVDLYTHVVANKEADDIFRAFFFSGVAEIEASTDLGYAYLLRQVAAKFSVKYILEGHSFIEEGVTPLGRNYFDGKYIKSIHRQFGKISMETYPLMTFSRFMASALLSQVKFIRPLWYVDYSKERAKRYLQEKFDWRYYGGHHLENRMTAFYHGVYLPVKFKTDMRNNTLSAKVRNGMMSREVAWREYNTPPAVEEELLSYFKKRLAISDEKYLEIIGSRPRNWTEYPTYKKRFERLRPIFHLMAKANLVPMSFYLKYCFPATAPK